MTTEAKKGREFYVSVEDSLGKNKSGGDMHVAHTKIKEPTITDIHVIEKSAYIKAVNALKSILKPVTCPACSMEEPAEGVPCYCFEEWNTYEYKARKALEELGEVVDE